MFHLWSFSKYNYVKGRKIRTNETLEQKPNAPKSKKKIEQTNPSSKISEEWFYNFFLIFVISVKIFGELFSSVTNCVASRQEASHLRHRETASSGYFAKRLRTAPLENSLLHFDLSDKSMGFYANWLYKFLEHLNRNIDFNWGCGSSVSRGRSLKEVWFSDVSSNPGRGIRYVRLWDFVKNSSLCMKNPN